MTYQVTIRKKAVKSLESILEPYYSKIKKAIYSLENNPRPSGCKKLKGRDGYRIRVADYRIIYEIFDDKLVVDVINLGHRQKIYLIILLDFSMHLPRVDGISTLQVES